MRAPIRAAQFFVVALVALIVLAQCGQSAPSGDDSISQSSSDLTACSEWNPTWQQGSGANNWWVEYVISNPSGGTVRSASLEVVGGQTVQLSFMWNKWVGPSSARIATGAQVIVHATSTLGQTAQTQVFGYLSVTRPQTQCASANDGGVTDGGGTDGGGTDGGGTDGGGTDSGGGADGGACWNPSWQQGSGANNWWVEYAIDANSVKSAYLEVVGVGNVTLASQYGKWVGLSSFRIATGTNVVVHATSTTNQLAQTQPFGYLVVTQPVTAPCGCTPSCTGKTCGDDGCGGSCGSCGANSTCNSGTCFCTGSSLNCDGLQSNGCESSMFNRNSCDVCGHVCPGNGTQYCGAPGGALVCVPCPTGKGDCDADGQNGCEVNLLANQANCGACGNACPSGQACQNGACVGTCTPPYTACGSVCLNLQSDNGNCGACGHACTVAQTCLQGTCVACDLDDMDCDGLASNGCETERLSHNNCGTCGNVCPANSYCTVGITYYCAACPTGFADCDLLGGLVGACETNLTNDAANCGACGHVCPMGTTCSGGTCQ